MKYLEINAELEKILINVFDAALKAGGFNIYSSVQSVIGSIKMKEDVPEPIKEVK